MGKNDVNSHDAKQQDPQTQIITASPHPTEYLSRLGGTGEDVDAYPSIVVVAIIIGGSTHIADEVGACSQLG